MLIKIVINPWDADLTVNKRLTTKIVANKNSLYAMFGETTNMGSWGKIKKKKYINHLKPAFLESVSRTCLSSNLKLLKFHVETIILGFYQLKVYYTCVEAI